MISIVLYGRNDNYGYNLHKRAALSLNCMAEVLTAESDEILFVDYNTPDDFPTFPEAIADTLTEHAKAKLRILRVRPNEHAERFGDKTHLKALEPVARNVAVRRSNPENRWILSTNTDMIFVPRDGLSLSNLLADISPGIYCTPRFEIPETLWESYDRKDPQSVIDLTRTFGEVLHLNEVVLGHKTILYDAPGDFQLIEREDLFDIHAFDEEMLLGWHVDSNISKRLFLKYGAVNDALPYVFGYHCDHTRQVTPMHRHKSPQNDLARFINDVTDQKAHHQADTWGLADVEIEEISLTAPISDQYREALQNVIGPRQTDLVVSAYQSNSFDKTTADPHHILPFLLDLYASLKRDRKIVWLGQQDKLYEIFSEALEKLGFTHPVEVANSKNPDAATLSNADDFVVNFGTPNTVEGPEEEEICQAFYYVVASEGARIDDGQDLRRIVAINAIHNRFEPFVSETVVVAKTPFSTRLRHGFVDRSFFAASRDWTPHMHVGDRAELQQDGRILATALGGTIAFGPYLVLPPGTFTVLVDVLHGDLAEAVSGTAGERGAEEHAGQTHRNREAQICIQVIFDEEVVQEHMVFVLEDDFTAAVPIEVSPDRMTQQIQIRVQNHGFVGGIGSVRVVAGHDRPALEATAARAPAPTSKKIAIKTESTKRKPWRLWS